MQTYAHRYPEEVAGVALVDSSIDTYQFSQRPEAQDSNEPHKVGSRLAVASEVHEQCAHVAVALGHLVGVLPSVRVVRPCLLPHAFSDAQRPEVAPQRLVIEIVSRK